MALRALLRPKGLRGEVVHVHFHDYELLDRRRALLFSWVLRFLARRRTPTTLGDLHADGDVDWSSVCAV
jgi:hypothetical protein